MSSPRVRVLVCLLALSPAVAGAAVPRFWQLESAAQLLAGEASGTAVDSDGQLRLAPASQLLHDPETASIWSLARDRRGVTWAGTGDAGAVYRIEAGSGRPLHEADAPHVYAVALAPDGRLYAAHSPDGRVEAIDAAGLAEPVFDPGDRYVWALAFDSKGRLLVATGASGRVYRVDAEGNSETLLESSQAHITALAVGPDDAVYAGSAPGAIVYRIAPDGHVFALHDSSYQEVKALAVAAGGRVYAALVGSAGSPQAAPATIQPLPPDAAITVTVTPQAIPAAPAAAGPSGGAVLLMRAGAAPELLWSSTSDAPHAMLAVEGGVLVGTGDDAKLFLVRDDRSWAMQRAFPAAQITALARGADGKLVLATSNPGQLFELQESVTEAQGEFVSTVHDAGLPARWGRLSWDAELPPGAVLTLQTRSGNTSAPDATWSEWSAPAADPGSARIESEEARFLQLKVTLRAGSGRGPRLSGVRAAYLQRNQRPNVGGINVYPPGQVYQKPLTVGSEPEILGLAPDASPDDGAAAANPSITGGGRPLFRRGLQTLTWNASDANGDRLEYDVGYRRVEESEYRPLRSGLGEAVLTWDTTSVPDGRYLVRVSASDRASNPLELALSGDGESRPFQVDNTPPLISLRPLEGEPGTLRAEVRDGASPLRRLEYALDAGRWIEVHPDDGIADALSESFTIRPELAPGKRSVVVVRVLDVHGNTASAMQEVERP